MNNIENNENKRNLIGEIKASFSGRKFRSGAYVSFLSAIVVIVVLVVNLIVSNMDLKADLSTQALYTLTDETEDLVENIKDDITLYYLAEAGEENPMFFKIAEKYDSISDNIKLETKDPILYPKFASQYVEDQVSVDSIIVVNNDNGRSKYIPTNEMLVQELNYQTYEYDTKGIDVEGKITSALQYVTNPELPVMYIVSGHGETETGDIFQSMMDKQNVKAETLSTITQSSIPEDCSILFINAPQTDFSEAEVSMIKDYMNEGGDVIVTLDYLADELVNFKSLLNYYGVEIVDGFVCEGDANRHLANYPHFIVPELLNHEITMKASTNKKYVLTPTASGLLIQDALRNSLTVEPLLSTSASAYSKTNINTSTISKEDRDIDGPFYLGLIAADKYSLVTSHMVVFSSASIFAEAAINSIQGYGNADILTGTIGYLAGDVAAVSIATKSLTPDYIYLTEEQGVIWGALTAIIIPILILGTGIIVCLRRRKK